MLPGAVQPRVEHGFVTVHPYFRLLHPAALDQVPDARIPARPVVNIVLDVGEHAGPVVLAARGGREDEMARRGHHVAEDADLRGELAVGHEADEGSQGRRLLLHAPDHRPPPGPEAGGRLIGLVAEGGGPVGEEAVLVGDAGRDEVGVLDEVPLDENAPQQLGGDVVGGLGDVHEPRDSVDHGLRPQLLGAVG